MANSTTHKIGQRLMVNAIDDIAEKDPERTVCIMPETTDSSNSFVNLNFRQLAHAVNYTSWWIEKSFGRHNSSPQETLTYLGANDSRYLIIVMACNKSGYQPLLSSTRNSQAAQLRLLEMTDCSKLAYSSERKQKAEEIKERRSDVKNAQIPSLAEMLASNTELYPFTKTFEEVKNDVAFIAHSSGTTGFPKPIRLTYGYFGALDHGRYVPIPEGRTAGVPDRLTPNDLILSTTPFFHMMGFSLMVMTVFHGIPCVILPDKPLSTDLLTTTLNSTKPTAALFPPCILEDMSASPASMNALSGLKQVYFGGGPLSPDAGRKVSERTKLVSFLGMTEGGWVLSLVPEDKENWSYFEWSPTFGIKMESIGEGGLAEMVLHRHGRPDLQPIFHTFPDIPAYHTKDLYSPHPTKPGLWKFHGRLDDVIVLNNGEKFNPVTMEKIIEGHPLVARAIVAGLGKFQTALIAEPNWNQKIPDDSYFIEEIWPTVQEANRISVAHGRVMKDKIGVASRDKPFSTTPKGSTQRRLVTDSYQDEIETLYNKRASADAWVDALSGATELSDIIQVVRNMVSQAISLSPAEFTDQMDLYSIGLDSLQTLQLSTILQVAGFKTFTPQMVYANPSVDRLSNLLYGIVHGIQTEESATARSERVDTLVKRYTDDLRQTEVGTTGVSNGVNGTEKKHAVILTGSTGSLGTYILKNLLNDSSVSKVYCLNRTTDAQERQTQSFKQKGLTTLEGSQADKVEFHTVTLNKEHFGLFDTTKYTEMLSTVDTVIHNAWRMDFNISVETFQDQIQAVRRLVDFCKQSTHHAHFYFMSSIGAIGEWKRSGGDTVPEVPFESCDVALRQGYGEAKHICERICLAASKVGVSTTILRLGQIGGPTTEAGMWNPWEWLPAIVQTSKTIGKIPHTLGAAPLDWIPVDTLSTIIQDLIHTRQTQESNTCAVFHLVNPTRTTWEALLPSIHKAYSNTIQPVDMQDWIEELERIEKPSPEDLATKPALKLLGFYRSLVHGEGALSVPLSVERAKEASVTMQGLGPISGELMGNWLRQWSF